MSLRSSCAQTIIAVFAGMDVVAYSYIVGDEVARLTEYRLARRLAADYCFLVCLVTNVFEHGL